MNDTKPSDNFKFKTYSQLMGEVSSVLELKIDTKDPIEVTDFVSSFLSLSSQFDKFMRATHPDLKSDAKVFVKEVRKGSIVADLIAIISPMFNDFTSSANNINTYVQFVEYTSRISTYFNSGGRQPSASKSDLKDFAQTVAAIANDREGKATLTAASFRDGKKEIEATFVFATPEARVAQREIEQHRLEIEHVTGADYERALMVFKQSNTKVIEPGKRSSERVIIEEISEKDLPLIYSSNLTEQRIKHEITESDENVYKKGFVVDVNVENRNGRPVAYRITNLHQIIDLPDED